MDSVQDGVIDLDSLDADTVDVLIMELERREAAHKKSLAERKRKNTMLDPPTKPTLQGKAVFIEPDVDINAEQLRDAQRAHGWHKVGYEKEMGSLKQAWVPSSTPRPILGPLSDLIYPFCCSGFSRAPRSVTCFFT